MGSDKDDTPLVRKPTEAEVEYAEDVARGKGWLRPGETWAWEEEHHPDSSELVCTLYQSRWHGFSRMVVERREHAEDSAASYIIHELERRWVWRGRGAPYLTFRLGSELRTHITIMGGDDVR